MHEPGSPSISLHGSHANQMHREWRFEMVTTATPANQDFSAAEIARFWNDQPRLTDFLDAKELGDILDRCRQVEGRLVGWC